MSDKPTILIGLVVFVVLATVPIWYALGIADEESAPAYPADLELPENSSQCVEDRQYMIANHMDLLNRWRDEVVRDGDNSRIEIGGQLYEKSPW